MARANGMPPTTLRRHLAVLVDCGLIVRRDSPNGKRFARKGRGGQVEQAYGFDLSPIVARAEEFEQLAEAVQAEKKAFKVAKERLTLLRRDIVKMIDAGIEEGRSGQLGACPADLPGDYWPVAAIGAAADSSRPCPMSCTSLWTEVHDILESFTKTQNPDANESHSGRHIQSSKPDSISESEHGLSKKR
jgi:replication initiation protein RepC